MICPKCRSRAIGRIGQNQYYCWDCSIEFAPTKDGFRMYRLESDGTTVLDSLDASPATAMMTDGAGGIGDSGNKDDKATQDIRPV